MHSRQDELKQEMWHYFLVARHILTARWYEIKMKPWIFSLQIPVVFEILEELWKVWPHNVWPALLGAGAQWRVETKHAWQLLILVRSLRSRSTNSKYVRHGMLHSVMSHDHESQSLINTGDKVTIDNQPSQNRFTPGWPLSTCPRLLVDGHVWACGQGRQCGEGEEGLQYFRHKM